jgi:antitoxin component of MazEF toxin-antitoxin module
MIKALTKVGNSKAIILPAQMIIKYKLEKKVMIEETEHGILIHAVHVESSFQKKLRKARENKEQIYRQMREDANDPEVQAYYKDPKNTLDDVQDLMDDY